MEHFSNYFWKMFHPKQLFPQAENRTYFKRFLKYVPPAKQTEYFFLMISHTGWNIFRKFSEKCSILYLMPGGRWAWDGRQNKFLFCLDVVCLNARWNIFRTFSEKCSIQRNSSSEQKREHISKVSQNSSTHQGDRTDRTDLNFL